MTLVEGIFSLTAGTLILAVGMRSEGRLAQDLEGFLPESQAVGD